MSARTTQPSGPPEPASLPTVPAPFFVTSGTLPLDAPSYVARAADRELFEALSQGEYCFVLHARQMGKSSLAVRCMQRLGQAGVRTIFLDLTKVGGASVTPEQWYLGLLSETGRALGLRAPMLAFWKQESERSLVERFFGAIRAVALAEDGRPLVLFVDEVDAVKSLPFPADEFFAAARACYNARVHDAVLRRLTFCLVGSAMPSDLIADTRTSPLNVGRRIQLSDLTEEEALALAQGLERAHAEALVRRVYAWTGGQPHLTQAICAEVARREEVQTPGDVDRLVAGLYFAPGARERSANLADVSNRVLSSYLAPERREEHRASVLDLYQKVLGGRSVPDDETSRVVAVLKLSGIVRSVGGRLVVRNRIYARVFDRSWVAASMPDAELRRQKAAYRRGAVRSALVSLVALSVVGALAVAAVGNARRARVNARRARLAESAEARQRQKLRLLLYVSDMEQVSQAWERGDVARARELIDYHRQERDLQGWEWGYCDRVCRDTSIHLPRRPGGQIEQIAFSASGRLLAASVSGIRHEDPGRVELWDPATRRLLPPIAGLPSAIVGVAFSPDGRTLAIGARHGTARVGHGGQLLLLDATTRRQIAALPMPSGVPALIRFSRDGRTVATGDYEGTAVRVWDVESRRLRRELRTHESVVALLGLSPDGTRIAAGGGPSRVVLRDVRTGLVVASAREAATITDLSTSPSGGVVAVGLESGAVSLRDGIDLHLVRVLAGHRAGIQWLTFSRDGRYVATASEDTTIRVWEAATGRELGVLRGHAAGSLIAAFSPDGRALASCAPFDNTARLWDLAPMVAAGGRDLLRMPQPAYGLAFSPAARQLAVGTSLEPQIRQGAASARLSLWDLATRRRVASAPAAGVRLAAFSSQPIAYAPNGRLVAAATQTGPVLLWDPGAPSRARLLKAHRGPVYGVAFSRDGRYLASGGLDRTALLWDMATGQVAAAMAGHSAWINGVAFSPQGHLLATASYEHQVRLWHVPGGTAAGPPIATDAWTQTVAFSPDGRWLAMAGGTSVKVWDTLLRRYATRPMPGPHGGRMLEVAFSPDGRTLAAGGEQGVMLLDTRTWQQVGGLETRALVHGLAFSSDPDGVILAAACDDSTVRLWRGVPGDRSQAPGPGE